MDGTVHFIPNGSINLVSNCCKKFARAVIEVGVAYDSDIDKVLHLLNEVGQSLKDDPEVKSKVFKDFQVMGVDSFADSSINLKMWIKTFPGEQYFVARYVRKKIIKAFETNKITIPFPQMVLHQAENTSKTM